ncbi:appr-1-p processing enzyme family domain-containing protein [Lentilactobacillus hilgardii]|nr:appr-1-p processing enzyme family domain-containing protein [Lentilactobacillus hilgardii]MBZ2203414.1 appr-1-p processing enzyme family domain-containing protein [Lentilactobacillus hilgardii]
MNKNKLRKGVDRALDQQARRRFLIKYMQQERLKSANVRPEVISDDATAQKRLLRKLFNLRGPAPASDSFMRVQDRYLFNENHVAPIIYQSDLDMIRPKIYLWQGDITQLAVDAIVNPANSRMLGCFIPNHGCLDNQIHTKAGIQLRLADQKAMAGERLEATGKAKLTPGFNLPAKFVIHTVGPVIIHQVTPLRRQLLAGSYQSCLELAEQKGLSELAFCCISTGEFRFPHDLAAQIAVNTVNDYLSSHTNAPDVIFAVNSDLDKALYLHELEGE